MTVIYVKPNYTEGSALMAVQKNVSNMRLSFLLPLNVRTRDPKTSHTYLGQWTYASIANNGQSSESWLSKGAWFSDIFSYFVVCGVYF